MPGSTRPRTITALIASLLLTFLAPPVYAQIQLDLPAQPLGMSLTAVGTLGHLNVLFDPSIVDGLQAPALKAEMSVDDAVSKLLIGTKLHAVRVDANTIRVIGEPASKRRVAAPPAADNSVHTADSTVIASEQPRADSSVRLTGADPTASNESEGDGHRKRNLEEVVVTGTNIPDARPESSPLSIFSVDDIKRTGSVTVEQFLAKLTQNVGTLSGTGPVTGAESNADAVNGIDLRGLGIGSTLVLLNGRRLALASQGRTPDLSLIPLSAVDRIEVLTDGASAIYGSDAVGGVVNIVLRRDLDGIQSGIGYGNVTSGSQPQIRANQSFGGSWNSGSALFSYDYFDQSALQAADRSFAASAAPFTLTPNDRRQNAFATVEQEIANTVAVTADLLYSRRSTSIYASEYNTSGYATQGSEEEQYYANFAASSHVTDKTTASLMASYSRLWERESSQTLYLGSITAGSVLPVSSTIDITAKFDGDALSIPGGPVKFSIGAGYSKDQYHAEPSNGLTNIAGRHTTYGFAEVLVPILGPREQGGPTRLQLSLAGRYTDYSDFGSKTSPKIGLAWSPFDGLTLRGTYSEAFRAPALSQLDPRATSYAIFPPAAFGFPDIWSPTKSSVMLFLQGPGNPDLGPENAKTYTGGIDLSPASYPDLKVSATYFNVHYTDRIAVGDATGGFAAALAPQDYPELFILNPTESYIASAITGALNYLNLTSANPHDPAAVAALVNVVLDNRIRNLASTEMHGADLAASIDHDIPFGVLRLGVQGTYIFSYRQQTTTQSSVQSLLNSVLHPVNLRSRMFAGIKSGGLTTQVNINYVNGYNNPFAIGGPARVASWTTTDLAASYELVNAGPHIFRGTTVSLGLQNLFNRYPPFVSVATATNLALNQPIGYDPVNANPLGRFLTVDLTKRW